MLKWRAGSTCSLSPYQVVNGVWYAERMELELVRECEITLADHPDVSVCKHRALIRLVRDDGSQRWLVDPEAGEGHPQYIAAELANGGYVGLVDTSASAFYVALAVLAL